MAQQYTLDTGEVVTIPATYVNTQVKTSQVGTLGSGVITVIGEADEGTVFSDETDLDANAFAPDELASVITKYGSGRIVDAFRQLTAPANDPAIRGSVSSIKIVKTNDSQKATSSIVRAGSQYAVVAARKAGAPGNAIQIKNTDYVAETAPVLASFSVIPHYGTSDVPFGVGANGQPNAYLLPPRQSLNVLTVDYAKNMNVNGIAKLDPLATGVSVTVTAPAAEQITVVAASFAETVAVGDVIVIGGGAGDFGSAVVSAFIGTASCNEGSYLVSVASPTSFTANRISKPGTLPCEGVVVALPVTGDMISFKPTTITNVGGTDRGSLVGMTGAFAFSVSGSTVTITAPTALAVQAVVGDYVRVITDINTAMLKGFYRVTASTSATITCSRISDGSAGVTGTATVATAMTLSTQIFKVERPTIDGLGKTLEVNGDVSAITRNPNGSASLLSNTVAVSAIEQKVTTQVLNRLANVSEQFDVGGEIVMEMASTIAGAMVTISATSMVFVAGATTFTILFSTFKNLQSVVDYVNAQTGFSASLVKPIYASMSPSVLDKGSFLMESGSLSRKVLRIKKDAYAWNLAVGASQLVTATMVAVAGLPEASASFTFLASGSKGATTQAAFLSAIDACEGVVTNMIVPLISQDATADALVDGTDLSSTYTIDGVNAYVNSHVIKMSTVRRRQNRMAFVSNNNAYAVVEDASGNLNSYRTAMAFQDVISIGVRFQSWMAAITAAGMSAAAGYRGIVKKRANVSGAIRADFDSKNPASIENALKSGLLIIERVPAGGYRWVSDQMTYSTDNNFVYNSAQAVYLSDLMTLSMIADFDNSIIGKSISEMSAAGAVALVEAKMADFLRLSWIASSDDAPMGYKNLTVKLVGGVMNIGIEVKINGIIMFCPINFIVSEATQTA